MKIKFAVDLLGPYWGHVWSILWPCCDYFYNIFSCKCLKWLQFSGKSQTCQIEECSFMLNFWYHIITMSGTYKGYVLATSTISLLLCALNGTVFYWRVIHAKWEKNQCWMIESIPRRLMANIRAKLWPYIPYLYS